jgi:hypothetical protein
MHLDIIIILLLNRNYMENLAPFGRYSCHSFQPYSNSTITCIQLFFSIRSTVAGNGQYHSTLQ